MNGRRKPRRARTIGNPLDLLVRATLRVSVLTPPEILSIIAPLQICVTALRQAQATHDQYLALCSSLQIAIGIENGGVVRGLREHLASATTALEAIEDRAMATGAWQPTALHYHELDAIRSAVDLHEFQLGHISAGELHEFQLGHISAGELHRIVQRLIHTTKAQGGHVQFASPSELGIDRHANA